MLRRCTVHTFLGAGLIVHGLVGACLAQSFTDDPLMPGTTTIKAVHVTELRSKIDTLRGELSLGSFPWTDSILPPRVALVNAADVIDLRTALNQTYQKAGKALPTYSDSIVARQTVIKAVHVNEVRGAFRSLLSALAPPPTITSPLGAGVQHVSGTGVPGATVEVFVNGVARGALALVDTLGHWTVSLSPPLAQGDVVTAQETVNGVVGPASASVTVGPALTQIAFTHVDGNCTALTTCAFNLRLMDPANPTLQTPLTAFPAGSLSGPPVWSKDFQQLAFASTLNGAESLEPFFSIYSLNANGTGLRQLTGNGVIGQLPGPTGTVAGHVFPVPAHSPVKLPQGTYLPCPNPPDRISAPCQLSDRTYYVPGTLLSCPVTAQGMLVSAPCNHLGDGSFELDNVPVQSSWVLASATVAYNDPQNRIPQNPPSPFYGFQNIVLTAGQVVNVTLEVLPVFHASVEASWSPDDSQLVVTGLGFVTSPQFDEVGNVVWKTDISRQLELDSANGTPVGIVPFPSTLQVINPGGSSGGTVPFPIVASGIFTMGGPDWSPVTNRIAFAVNGLLITGDVLEGVVMMNRDAGDAVVLRWFPPPLGPIQFVKAARWSPNGGRIAFTVTTETVSGGGTVDTDDLFVINVNGTNPIRLTQNLAGITIQGFSWSPDGGSLAFDLVTTTQVSFGGSFPVPVPTSGNIFVISANGTVQLTNDGRSFGPAWRVVR